MNQEKYDQTFINALEVTKEQLAGLEYQKITSWDSWDSVGHMNLISELEDAFNIMMDTDDIIDLSSYEKGKEILGKYGITF